MAIEWHSVFSSNVDEIGWDPDTGELHVRWSRGGRTSVYSGVPEDVATRVMSSWSVGAALRDEIKSAYAHRYSA